jgi:hypothetical protein
MPASLPVAEMAETLRVLAGSNASNAAHHFTSRCYETGDIASAALWSTVAGTLDGTAPAAAETDSEAPVPAPIRGVLEDMALRDARFEDVEADVLAHEDLVLRFHREMTELASDDDFEGGGPAQDDGFENPAALAQAA